jgi:hypothetical protein
VQCFRCVSLAMQMSRRPIPGPGEPTSGAAEDGIRSIRERRRDQPRRPGAPSPEDGHVCDRRFEQPQGPLVAARDASVGEMRCDNGETVDAPVSICIIGQEKEMFVPPGACP